MVTKTLVAFLLAGGALAVGAQEGSATPREAALRFALANGLAIPKDVVVGRETTFRAIDGPITTLSTTQLDRAAADLAKAVGPTAQSGSAESWLMCRKSSCVPISRAVLLVNEPDMTSTGASVFIQAFLPSDSPEYHGYKWLVVVDVETRKGLWIGTRNRLGPTKVGVRIDK